MQPEVTDDERREKDDARSKVRVARPAAKANRTVVVVNEKQVVKD
jgi:hypothetical protein